MRLSSLCTIALLTAFAAARPVAAQQVDLYVSYLPGDLDTHYPIVGGGLGVRKFIDLSRVYLGVRGGIGYAREEHLGPGRGSLGLDFTLAPHHEFTAALPYIGAGVSINVSGGQQSQFSGFRSGLDAIAGLDVNAFHSDRIGLKLEERYGRIQGMKASPTTRAGFVLGL